MDDPHPAPHDPSILLRPVCSRSPVACGVLDATSRVSRGGAAQGAARGATRRVGATPFAALVLLVPGAPAAQAAGIETGQSLASALRALSAQHGLATVFSAELVPDRLRVLAVPALDDAQALRAALLAQHGLRCRELHRRCVVEREPAPGDDPPGAAAPVAADAPTPLPRVSVAPSHYSLMQEGANFLSADDIAATPHLADDVFRLARSIPGVSGGDLSAPFHVRGGQTDEIALRVDGLELYRPFHLHNLVNALGILDSNLIGAIDVYTGAWPSRFGGRMSAVMDIRSRQPGAERERRLGVSAINAFYSHVEGAPDARHATVASLRRGYLDVVLEFVDPDGSIDPGYYDVFLRHEREIADGHRLSWQLLQAGDRIVYDGDAGTQRSDGASDASYAWMRWQVDRAEHWSSETLLAWTRLAQQREGFAFDAFETNARVRDRRDLSGLRLVQRFDWQWREHSAIEAGAEWRIERSDYEYRSDVEVYPLFSRVPTRYTRSTDARVSGEQAALWLDASHRLAPGWILRGGVRHAWYSPGARRDTVLDPHLALAWSPHPDRSLRLGWHRSSQSQRSDELAVEDGDLAFYRPERARQWVLGWEERLAPGLTLRAEAFDKRWSQLRPRFQNLFEPVELFPESEGDRIRVLPEDARSRGIEVGLDGRLAQGRWWARYVYSRARERLDGRWQARAWDQPHALHLGWDRRFREHWRLTAQLDAHSGWPTTAVAALQRPDGRIEAVYGPRNGERFDPYLTLSARLSREHRLRLGELRWYVEVFNLLDRDNPNLVEQFRLRRAADGALRVEREFAGGLPLLPSFGLTWRF